MLKADLKKVVSKHLRADFETGIKHPSGAYVEVFRNPSRREIESLDTADFKVLVEKGSRDIYVWSAYYYTHDTMASNLHLNSADIIPLVVTTSGGVAHVEGISGDIVKFLRDYDKAEEFMEDFYDYVENNSKIEEAFGTVEVGTGFMEDLSYYFD